MALVASSAFHAGAAPRAVWPVRGLMCFDLSSAGQARCLGNSGPAPLLRLDLCFHDLLVVLQDLLWSLGVNALKCQHCLPSGAAPSFALGSYAVWCSPSLLQGRGITTYRLLKPGSDFGAGFDVEV